MSDSEKMAMIEKLVEEWKKYTTPHSSYDYIAFFKEVIRITEIPTEN